MKWCSWDGWRSHCCDSRVEKWKIYFWGLWEVCVKERAEWVGTSKAAAHLAAGMSNSCSVLQVVVVGYKTLWRLPWTAVPVHLTDGVAFSVFHADPSDKDLVHSKRVRKPSSFHPPPPELSSKGFYKKNRATSCLLHLSSSATPNLSFCMLLGGGSHWGHSKPLLSSVYFCEKTVSPLFCLSTNLVLSTNCFSSPVFQTYIGQTAITGATHIACDCY